jgi:radical SAM enzyme (TIGR01210 family)
MNKLQSMASEIRGKAPVKDHNPRAYIACWSEKDVLEDKIVDALVVILRTRGCAWALTSGCSMCGYINDCGRDQISPEPIIFQFEHALDKFSGSDHDTVKIFTSGSFIDDKEVNETVQSEILKRLSSQTRKVIIESRPEFIKPAKLDTIHSIFENVEIAIGLESANDFILKNSINKGFKFQDYLTAAKLIQKHNLLLKTYLLIKPPFLTERESIEDAVNSVNKINENKIEGTISFNPVHIQNYTIVERLWHRHEYRPPWLWSVVEVIKKADPITNSRLMSAPTAGGKKRGPHNCGKCDNEVLQAIENFSLSGNIDVFKNLDCECKNKWHDIIEVEGFSKSGGVFTH